MLNIISHKENANQSQNENWGYNSVVGHLVIRHRALESILITTKNKAPKSRHTMKYYFTIVTRVTTAKKIQTIWLTKIFRNKKTSYTAIENRT